MTPYRLAKGLRVTPARVAEILVGKRDITPDTALRLAAFLGTTPEGWLNHQRAYDVERPRARLASELSAIEPYVHTGPIHLDNRDGTEDVVTDEPVSAAARRTESGCSISGRRRHRAKSGNSCPISLSKEWVKGNAKRGRRVDEFTED